MKLRERIADWISGGQLSRETERADFCRDQFHLASDKLEALNFDVDWERCWERKFDEAQNRLNRIAACEKIHANSTIRHMARIARGELE